MYFEGRPPEVAPPAGPFVGVPVEAHKLYLDAYYLWQKRTPETLAEAQRLLTRVLDMAPGFVTAQADLATVYDLMVEAGVTSPEDGYALSRKAAERALELDPHNAQAHSVLGDIVYFWDRDYEAGLDHLRQAVEYNPKSAISRHWYASALRASGRFDAAAKQIEVARELEPLSRSIIISQAMILIGQRHVTPARDLLRQLAVNEPNYRSPYRFLAFCALARHDYPGYLAALRRRFELVDDPAAERIVDEGEAALRRGGHDAMVKALFASTQRNAESLKDPFIVAHFLALGGDWAGAAHWLAQTPTRRFSYYGIDPAFDEARQDPAFRKAILKYGLPAIW